MPRIAPTLKYESAFWRDGLQLVAGLDEVGRGALAGPVVAAAVILPPLDAKKARIWMRNHVFKAIARANDSKLLTPKMRQALYEPICELARAYSIGIASVEEIDTFNIARASRLAMLRALEALPLPPDALLIDALILHDVHLPQQGIIHGDALALSISVASILAKVTRDRMMEELDAHYPGYGFAQHKGYSTPEHIAALREFGPTPIHRRSFAPVKLTADGRRTTDDR